MEKRLLLAIVLMMAVVFLVNLLFPPQPPRPGAVGTDTTGVVVDTGRAAPGTTAVGTGSVSPATRETTAARPPAAAARPETGQPRFALPTAVDTTAAPAETVWVGGPLYRLGFVPEGARLVSAELLKFESLAPAGRGRPVQLVPPGAPDFLTHRWVVGDDTLDLRNAHFEIEPPGGVTLQPGDSTQTLTFTYRHPDSPFTLQVRYRFRADRYVVDLEGRLGGVPGTGWWLLGMGDGLLSNEWNPEQDYKTNLSYEALGPDGLKAQKVTDLQAGQTVTLDGPFEWVAVRTKYFVAATVVTGTAAQVGQFAGLRVEGSSEPHRARAVASFPVSRDGRFSYQVYLGPQDYGRLKAAGHDLDEVMPYGYKWLQPILRPLVGAIIGLLVWTHKMLAVNYGWILILFGIAIRVVLFPLYQKSMRSQMSTMRVQPLMKEIQNKYKNDPQRLQQEMMKLYREHKINPLGGCLPMLLPWPILIALFFVFRDTIEFRGVPFLWLPDLSQPDPYYIIPIVMGASVFLLQWIGQRNMPQSNPQMKIMMWVMPVFLTVLFLNFAAGLNLYYATMNLASIPQQLYLAKERQAMTSSTPVRAKT